MPIDDTTEKLLLEAFLTEEIQDLPGAVVIYQRALVRSPERTDIHVKIAQILARQGELDTAISELNEVIATGGADANCWLGLADLLHSGGRVQDAIAAYRRALELEPNDSWVLGRLGEFLLRRGEFAEAASLFSRAAAEAEDQSMVADWMWSLGCALLHSGEKAPAIETWERVLRREDTSEYTRTKVKRALQLSSRGLNEYDLYSQWILGTYLDL